MEILFFIVSLLASVAGAICGIGGGVVIKPTLDLFRLASVSTISFLSGCTVLSMSTYSVGKSLIAREHSVDLKNATPLGIGAAIGGVAGQKLFSAIRAMFENANRVGSVQAICLFAVTLGTFFYTLRKDRIRTKHLSHPAVCVMIGLALGVMSSFLGIGGGPINLVVLSFFFSLETKKASQNSLYIILISQIANLITILVEGNVPPFNALALILMVAGGIGGGIIGRRLYKRMDAKAIDKLFLCLMVLIMAICVWNAWNYR